MQPICTHKISVQSSKPSHAYPIIRLPREYRELAGSRADIFQTTHRGKLAFLVTTDREVDNSCLLLPEINQEEGLAPSEFTQQSEAEKCLCSGLEGSPSSTIVRGPRRCNLIGSRSAGPTRARRRHGLRFENEGFDEALNQAERSQSLGLDDDSSGPNESLTTLELYYKPDELESFLNFRLVGLSSYSLGWPRRAAAAFWECTQGRITKARMEALRMYAIDRFCSSETQAKFLSYARAFLSYLTKTRLDFRYESFRLFLELPKAVKTCKLLTGRIVTIEDVQNALVFLKRVMREANSMSDTTSRTKLQSYLGLLQASTQMQRSAELQLGSLKRH